MLAAMPSPDAPDPTLRDATGLAAAIRDGELSAREAVEESIARIEKHSPPLNAVVATRFEEALAEADAELPDGPLRGVPMLVKDLFADVAGLPSTKGSRLFADFVPEADSEVVARYKRAGLVVLGTTNVPELGLNGSTEGQLFGPCRNPRSLDHSTGGSSGGSAVAVATGMVPVAHATDGGGSIRIPASMNGLFGLKPSRGRIPAAPYATSLSGPLSAHHAVTTTVRDSALLLDVTAGPLPGDAYAAPTPEASFVELAAREPGRLRVGLATVAGDGRAADEVCAAVTRRAAALLEELGHDVEEVTLDYSAEETGAAVGALMGAGLLAGVEARLSELGRELRDDDLEPFTRSLYDWYGESLSAADVTRALQTAQRTGWRLGRQLTTYDVFLTPTLAAPVPVLGTLDTMRPESLWEHGSTYSAFTSIYNLTGQPAMSVPFGADADGLPIGVQLVADLGGEGLLLSLATQLEQAAPWQRHAAGY